MRELQLNTVDPEHKLIYALERTYFEKALNVNDKYAMAELGLAKVFEALGERDKYLEHLRKAQELDPKNNVILKEVAKVQSK